MRNFALKCIMCFAALALISCAPDPTGQTGLPPSSIKKFQVVVPASDLHPCEITGTQLTNEDCKAAQYWLEKSKSGTAALSAPTRMLQGETKLVTLAIGTAPPPQQPLPKLTPPEPPAEKTVTQSVEPPTAPSGSKPDGPRPEPPAKPKPPQLVEKGETPHEAAVRATGTTDAQVVDYYPFVGRQMSADLEGSGFDIKLLSPRVQPLAEGAVTTWTWEVTARDYGKKTLIIRTAVIMMDSQGNPAPLIPTSEFKEVTVGISLGGVLELLKSLPDWLKIITSILAGVAALVGAWKSVKVLFNRRR